MEFVIDKNDDGLYYITYMKENKTLLKKLKKGLTLNDQFKDWSDAVELIENNFKKYFIILIITKINDKSKDTFEFITERCLFYRITGMDDKSEKVIKEKDLNSFYAHYFGVIKRLDESLDNYILNIYIREGD